MEDGSRPGDNLYTCSLVALDINTGKLKWYYQQIPHDRWGYDVASPPIIFDLKKEGKIPLGPLGRQVKWVGFSSIMRQTGELLIRSEPFIEQDNLFAPPN